MNGWFVLIISVKIYILIFYNIKIIWTFWRIYLLICPCTSDCSPFHKIFDYWGTLLDCFQNIISMKQIATSTFLIHQVSHIISYTLPHFLRFYFCVFHLLKGEWYVAVFQWFLARIQYYPKYIWLLCISQSRLGCLWRISKLKKYTIGVNFPPYTYSDNTYFQNLCC